MKREAAGFTLLELIVVIGIFAVFAAMAYGGLESVLKTRAQVEASLERTEALQRAYLRVRTDFENAANRGIRDTDGTPRPGFAFDNYLKRVEFTRGGWLNLLSMPRATLERVAYSLDDAPANGPLRARTLDKRLVRRSWRQLDRAPQSEAVETVVLEHVDEAKWRFMDTQHALQDSWPVEGSTPRVPILPVAGTTPASAAAAAAPPPLAVELRFTTRDWGEVRWLFRVGAEGLSALPPPPPPSSASTR